MRSLIERNFVWVILIFSTSALLWPLTFVWIKPYIAVLLGIILFGIGFTLDQGDFKLSWQSRRTIVLAIIARYASMPVLAYFIGRLLHLSTLDLVGLVVLGSCPGGTAASVMSYLSRGNVALTIMLTFGTTLVAPLAMPGLIYFFLHQEIVVPFWGMLENILLIIFIPVVLGILAKKYFTKRSLWIAHIFPSVAIVAISLAVACILALAREKIFSFPLWVLMAVLLFNLLGYAMGFMLAKLLRCQWHEQKSIIFEYGMFDAALGVLISVHFFGPVAALPSAVMSIIQNLTASFMVKRFVKAETVFKQPLYCSGSSSAL